MQNPINGNTVKVHYIGKYDDGQVFDSTEGSEPFEFVIGEDSVIQGFEEAIMTLSVGEKKQFTIGAEKAYGLYDDNLVFKTERTNIPADMELEEGMMLNFHDDEEDEEFEMCVLEFDDKEVTLDGNHPLAGEDLSFEIELLEIK